MTSTARLLLPSFPSQHVTFPTFVLTNMGGGRYEGSFSFSGARPQTVTVRRNLGGSATVNVR